MEGVRRRLAVSDGREKVGTEMPGPLAEAQLPEGRTCSDRRSRAGSCRQARGEPAVDAKPGK
jgi:hypothetical protein